MLASDGDVCLDAMCLDAPQLDSGDIWIGTSDLATSLRPVT
jgi:hypothetical protein